jgi:hypothetical protein
LPGESEMDISKYWKQNKISEKELIKYKKVAAQYDFYVANGGKKPFSLFAYERANKK